GAGMAAGPAALHPLRDVAVDLLEARRSGDKRIDRPGRRAVLAGFAGAVNDPAIIVRLLGRDRRAEPERRRGAGPGGMLSLRFAQEAIGLAGGPGEPRHIFPGIVPRHVDHGPAAAAPAFIGRLVALASAAGDARLPFVERHGKPAGRKWSCNRHLVLRPLVRLASLLALRRAHQKLARR